MFTSLETVVPARGSRELLHAVDVRLLGLQLPVDLIGPVLAPLVDSVDIGRCLRSTGLVFEVEVLKVFKNHYIAKVLRHEICSVHLPWHLNQGHNILGCCSWSPR